MQTEGAPSDSRFGRFVCEEAVITNVNRSRWTVDASTLYSQKPLRDLQWASPYLHYTGGEGIYFMPEIGAHCYVATPNDNTPAFILCFVSPPAVVNAEGNAPIRSTASPEGSNTDISYQSNRPDMNPGDMGLSTRDGNFIILRRGGVLQLGATPLAQRICVPVRNFVHDYAENYELATPAGDVTWLIDRPELDPAGKPPCSYTFHLHEFATDKNATIRVRHLSLAASGSKKAAWDVSIAPNGINRSNGQVSSPVYTLLVLTDGSFAEMIGANRSVEVKGDDFLKVGGNHTIEVQKTAKLTANEVGFTAKTTMTLAAKALRMGGADAIEPAVKGNAFFQWLSSAVILTASGGPGTFSPASLAQFQSLVLSKAITLK